MNNRKNKNLREPILKLHAEGKKLREIKMELNCSYSTISYHLYPKTKISTQKRYNKAVEAGKWDEYQGRYNNKNVLNNKFHQFFRLGSRKHKFLTETTFTLTELKEKIGQNPKCYLTGKQININNPKEYSLDHKIPSSRGGENSLDNVEICDRQINIMKNDRTPEELIQICKDILIHQGYTISKN